ncbi:MAG: hypothetical protein JSW47_15265 [Phycisphaerales bacterium]|nr:MAG: hypothetical protein JSW47_15265 [Phycisphaerales bacterium]
MKFCLPGDCHTFEIRESLLVGLLSALTAANNISQTDRDVVTLTMTERAGVAREAEWITVGVPLPKGSVQSTGELCLHQAGMLIWGRLALKCARQGPQTPASVWG